MHLEYILELTQKAKLRLEDGQVNYTLSAIDEAIDELKKTIEKNDKMKKMGASAPNIEVDLSSEVKYKKVILKDGREKRFWKKCYATALNCGYANTPQDIADMGILEFRKRL